MINKILNYLGYNTLGLVLDQERKHWLMKTDKRKQVQDKTTGDIYQGFIDNRGSDIKITSEKLPIKSTIIPTLKFVDEGCNKILDFGNAVFPFSMGCKGLLFSRITSINYPIETENTLQYKNYRIKFSNVVERTLVFGISPSSPDVYSGRWLETSTVPKIQMMDEFGDYTIEVDLYISNSTGVKYYYPLEGGLQPFSIEQLDSTTYCSEAINDDGYIGYPLFWFNSNESKTGPSVSLNPVGGYNTSDMAYMLFSTPGNSNMYNGKAYVNVDGTSSVGSTPDGSLSSNWEIRCGCIDGVFENNNSDFSKAIDIENIYFHNKNNGTDTNIPILSGEDENNIFKMVKDIGWTYVSDTAYKIDMDVFESNNPDQYGSIVPLKPIFDIELDQSIPYYVEDVANIGYAGIEFTSSNPVSDTLSRYPHDLDKWTGLPEWYSDPSIGVPEHMAIYAIHNAPDYSEQNPESRQVAALLLDPGVQKVEDSEELENDERGRIYVISNDPPEYENNATSKYPKPARTVARMCDIPTSVADFLNVEGLVPVAIVDPKYVRSQAAYTTDEKERLWNTLNSKIVTPMADDIFGNPFYTNDDESREPYPYIFSNINNLRNVDMVEYNDFREWINLNSMVDPTKVSVYSIANAGTDYTINATGIVVIGGVGMNYIVNAVDDNGGVTEVEVVPQDNETFINLSNFDMQAGTDGITQKYGTTPTAGESVQRVGSGLEIILRIDDYDDIRVKRGDIYDNLVAFVYEESYLKMYRYITDSSSPMHIGRWGDPMIVTHYDKTNPIKDGGGYSSTDALTRFLIPYIQTISVCSDIRGRTLERINAMTTPSFINIIDKTHTPIHLSGEDNSTLSHVDLCGLHCEGLSEWIRVSEPTEEAVMDEIKRSITLDRDCYLIWQWRDNEYKEFRYGIIRRSMNNYVTTDTTTIIPPINDVKYNSYINTNASTTVVWDVPNLGPMMWIYNPNYNKKEIYNIDQNTNDLYISYSNEDSTAHPNIMSWKDVDIRISPYGHVEENLISEDEKFNFYVYTNNPVQGESIPSSGIYNEFEFVKIASQGETLTPTVPSPVGNWQLVFPRLNQYKIVSSGIQEGVYNTEVKLQRLIPLTGEDVGNISNVVDSHGNNINQKVVVFDQGETGTKMKVWNKETGQFEIV